MKKNDAFLLTLLIGSLCLNVYLGLKIRRSRVDRTEAEQISTKLLPGMVVPSVIASSLTGKRETIAYADSGLPTVFYVFSPSCIWCERNTLNINAIAIQKKNSFRFIGLSLSDDDLPAYVDSHHLAFPIYKDVTAESRQVLGLAMTPETIVITHDGHVLKNWFGAFSSRIQPEVEQFFDVKLPGLKEAQND